MKYKLKEISNVSSSKRIYAKEYTPKGIPFYRGKEIIAKSQGYKVKDSLFISIDKFKELKENYDIPKANDILISAVGTIGKIYLVRQEDLPFYFKDGNLIKVTVNNEKNIDTNYLYYYLTSSIGQEKIKDIEIGSTQKAITIKSLSDIEVDLPSLATQKQISSRLLKIDEKVKLNNQINDNLISQLKIISNGYFSYFEAYNGKIPLDWSYIKLVDIANIDAGYSYTSKELVDSNIAMATIKNFDRTGGFNIRGFKEIKPNKIVKKEKYAKLFDILVAHTDLTQNADIIGNAEPILNTSKYSKIIYSMDLVKVTPKAEKISPFLLALLLQGDRLKKHCLGYVNGTTVLHLSKKALKEFEFPFPTSFSDLDNIAKFAERNYKLISNNMKENQKLQNLKQVLLSKYF